MSSFLEICQGTIGVERQMKLVTPTEFKTGFAQCIVADLCRWMTFGEVGRMGGNLVGDDTRSYIFPIGQTKMLFRSDIAEHGRAQPTDLCGSDGRGDVVVTRCDIGDQRAEGIERCVVAFLDLPLHVLLDFV